MYNTRDKPGQVTSVPFDLFTNAATGIRRIVISGQKGLIELPETLFADVVDLTILILSNNGLTNRGVVNTMFQRLFGLQIFDMSMNQFTTFDSLWVNPFPTGNGWAYSLTHFYLQGNPISKIEPGAFDNFSPNSCQLEVMLLHDTDEITVPMEFFDMCMDTLITYTLSPRA